MKSHDFINVDTLYLVYGSTKLKTNKMSIGLNGNRGGKTIAAKIKQYLCTHAQDLKQKMNKNGPRYTQKTG